jgi:hypothetical protein
LDWPVRGKKYSSLTKFLDVQQNAMEIPPPTILKDTEEKHCSVSVCGEAYALNASLCKPYTKHNP